MSKTSVILLNETGQVIDANVSDERINTCIGELWVAPSADLFDIEHITLNDSTAVVIRCKATDSLTGARSREDFETDLLCFHQRKPAFALGMCDLNQLKRINDKQGHLAGDAHLKSFVARLQAHLRQRDTVYRYGGDEFVILFAQVQYAKNLPFMQARLASAIGSYATIGIAHSTETATPTELIDLADQRMYEAKLKYKKSKLWYR